MQNTTHLFQFLFSIRKQVILGLPITLLTVIILLFVTVGNLIAQTAPARSTPYTAVEWKGDSITVMIGAEWYLLSAIEGIEMKDIASFSKGKYHKYWRKRISLDLVEVLGAMGDSLRTNVTLSLRKAKKKVELSEAMTTKNRRAVWEYVKTHPVPETEDAVASYNTDELQGKIAKAVNLTMDKPFQIKSAKVEYTIEGNKMFAGSETFYIDDYGKTVVVITDLPNKPFGGEKTTTIWSNNKTTVINHIKKSYYTSPIRTKSSEPPVISYSNATQRKQGGYESQSSQTIAGKKCEVFKHNTMTVTYCLWNSIPLKEINYSMGEELGFTKEATSVEELSSIPTSMLEIPSGYTKQ